MPESPTDRFDLGPGSGETTNKQTWSAPVLTVLGDARTLTETGGQVNIDGTGSFGS